MSERLQVRDPATGLRVVEMDYMNEAKVETALQTAQKAQREWKQVPVSERVKSIDAFVEALKEDGKNIAREITLQMGKPLSHAHGELGGTIQRARHMASIAEEALAEEILPPLDGFHRSISREPVGIVFDIAAWNYPLLVAVNAVVPAVLAGNAVLIKHSPITPLTADRFEMAFARAGVPSGLVQSTMVTHETAASIIGDKRVGSVSFVGSTRGGREVLQTAARNRFIDVGLELGGKDPAYVAADANLDFAIANVMEGAFFNAGQSCCAIERLYVHKSIAASFIERAVAEVQAYIQGDPMAEDTFMGPMALPSAPAALEAQLQDAKEKGASILCGGGILPGPGRFFQPTVVTGVNHTMSMMTQESFGPIIGIQVVESDEEAIHWMNQSDYGLTASVWTEDPQRAEQFASQLETGTVFMNRCDYLDPAQPWTGVKNTGRGVTLSRHGFGGFTRFKNRHFRLNTQG